MKETSFDYGRLRQRMRVSGVTQKTLAAEIGTNPSYLCRKLNNEAAFSQEEIFGICDALEISVSDVGTYFFTPVVE